MYKKSHMIYITYHHNKRWPATKKKKVSSYHICGVSPNSSWQPAWRCFARAARRRIGPSGGRALRPSAACTHIISYHITPHTSQYMKCMAWYGGYGDAGCRASERERKRETPSNRLHCLPLAHLCLTLPVGQHARLGRLLVGLDLAVDCWLVCLFVCWTGQGMTLHK